MFNCKGWSFGFAALGAFLGLTEELHAEEGAGGQYIVGAYSSIVDITPNTPGFAMGSDFYFYTGDSGSGADLGSFEGTDIGIGPVVTLIHKTSNCSFSAQAKWLPELQTQNRLTGNSFWFSVGMQF